ncbi:hypothetical protein BpHYR1_007494 [Brachionus plicatilis]|uniref:Uncharacterized protein n=1 Tax=Brachionus plicatilis TaxID=10195 RepID=A0A3M7REF8_BRAPC|nr:hypothetical protein BpHYR1_007494 [Brachionus plicatilis]
MLGSPKISSWEVRFFKPNITVMVSSFFTKLYLVMMNMQLIKNDENNVLIFSLLHKTEINHYLMINLVRTKKTSIKLNVSRFASRKAKFICNGAFLVTSIWRAK